MNRIITMCKIENAVLDGKFEDARIMAKEMVDTHKLPKSVLNTISLGIWEKELEKDVLRIQNKKLSPEQAKKQAYALFKKQVNMMGCVYQQRIRKVITNGKQK